jgi:hypothetical protein
LVKIVTFHFQRLIIRCSSCEESRLISSHLHHHNIQVVVLDEQESHSGLVLASWLNGRQGSILLENMILIPLKMLTNTTDAKKIIRAV